MSRSPTRYCISESGGVSGTKYTAIADCAGNPVQATPRTPSKRARTSVVCHSIEEITGCPACGVEARLIDQPNGPSYLSTPCGHAVRPVALRRVVTVHRA